MRVVPGADHDEGDGCSREPDVEQALLTPPSRQREAEQEEGGSEPGEVSFRELIDQHTRPVVARRDARPVAPLVDAVAPDDEREPRLLEQRVCV